MANGDTSSAAPRGPGRPHLLVWQDKLAESVGFHAVGLMDYVRRIGYGFQANVAQYMTLVQQMQDPGFALPILSASNPQAHDDLLSEAERLLHNILMSLSTRIDQQRTFMKRHLADDAVLTAEYAKKIELGFGAYLPGMFLRDLRNYLTHHRLPVAQSRQTFSAQSYSVTFILVGQSLREWSGWKGATKKWLREQPDEIEIVDMVDGYAQLAGSFDRWLFDRIAFKYADEIREYDVEARAFDLERSRIFGL